MNSITNKRVTIICCYNNISQYENELIQSLSNQNENYDLISIDNTNRKYSSCSKAFNSVIDVVKTKYVVYSHQDIFLKTESLSRFVDYMESGQIGDIFGVAGTDITSDGILTAIHHGTDCRAGGKRILQGIKECDTVDECFFGGLTETFRKYPFDEMLCDNWHLYAVDRCLNNKAFGHHVFVCEIELIHTSSGKLNHAFNKNFKLICKHYQDIYDEVYTTCARSKTNVFSRNIWYFKSEARRITEGIFHNE